MLFSRSLRFFSALTLAAAPLLAGVPNPTAPTAKPAPPTAKPVLPAEARVSVPRVLGLSAFRGGLSTKEAPVDWIAGTEVLWRECEPEKGKYSWKKLDEAIGAIDRAGASAIPVFLPKSPWGSSPRPSSWVPPGGGVEPVTVPIEMETWKGFVRRVVERYDGDGVEDMPGLVHPIRAWQAMPDLGPSWAGETAETVEYLEATSAAASEAAPRAYIVLGTLSDSDVDLIAIDAGAIVGKPLFGERVTKGVIRGKPNLLRRVNFLTQVLDEAKDSYDIIDIGHTQSSTGVAERFDGFAEWLHRKNIEKKALWSLMNMIPHALESGLPDPKAVASEAIRATLAALLGGCTHYGWPAEAAALPPRQDLAPYPLLDGAGKPQLIHSAWVDLVSRLAGLSRLDRWSSPGDAADAVVIAVETTSVPSFVVVWKGSNTRGPGSFKATGKVQVKNPVTGESFVLEPKDETVTLELGPYPLYVTGILGPAGAAPAKVPPATK